MRTDFLVNDCGSIVVIRPLTKKAHAWVDSNVESEGWQWLCGSLCIDHRFAAPVIEGMREAGLKG